MDENMKKPIMIVIIVICLGLAGAITFLRGGDDSGISSLKGRIQACKCAECGAAYEMDAKDFYDQIQAYIKDNPDMSDPPALLCEKCGQRSVFRAIKCEKCGNIFFRGEAGPNESPDRCPKCKFSKTKERMGR